MFAKRIDHILVSNPFNTETNDPNRVVLKTERTMRLPLLKTLEDKGYLFPNHFDQGSDHMPIAADIRMMLKAELSDRITNFVPDPDGHSQTDRQQPLRSYGTIKYKHRKDKNGNFRVF